MPTTLAKLKRGGRVERVGRRGVDELCAGKFRRKRKEKKKRRNTAVVSVSRARAAPFHEGDCGGTFTCGRYPLARTTGQQKQQRAQLIGNAVVLV